MIILRGLIILSLFLPGDARRSFRIEDSRHDAQQQSKTLTKDFEVSAEGKDALLPSGLKSTLFRKGEKLLPQGGALPRFPSATMNLRYPGYDSNGEHWHASRGVRYTDGWGDAGEDRRSWDRQVMGASGVSRSLPVPPPDKKYADKYDGEHWYASRGVRYTDGWGEEGEDRRSWDWRTGVSVAAAAPSTPSAAAAPSTPYAPEVAQAAGAGASELVEGKGFGGGEATRDPKPTYIDPNDPKGKQQAIHKVESFADYLARRNGVSATAAAPSQGMGGSGGSRSLPAPPPELTFDHTSAQADPDKKYANKYDGERWYETRGVRYTGGWGDEGQDRRSWDRQGMAGSMGSRSLQA